MWRDGLWDLFISIHAPLAESDLSLSYRGSFRQHKFQSTLPSRRATFVIRDQEFDEYISIHAPLAESDAAGT